MAICRSGSSISMSNFRPDARRDLASRQLRSSALSVVWACDADRFITVGELGAANSGRVRLGTGRWFRRCTLAFLPLPMLGAPIESFVDGKDYVRGFVVSAGALLIAWLLVFRPRLEVGSATLRVVNSLRSKTIAREDISDFSAGYHGLEIVGHAGRRIITAHAVFRSNWSVARKTRSRGVVIEEALRDWLSGDTGPIRSLPPSLR